MCAHFQNYYLKSFSKRYFCISKKKNINALYNHG